MKASDYLAAQKQVEQVDMRRGVDTYIYELWGVPSQKPLEPPIWGRKKFFMTILNVRR
jgi:hypothetical protein